jgi:hypothetical protein
VAEGKVCKSKVVELDKARNQYPEGDELFKG